VPDSLPRLYAPGSRAFARAQITPGHDPNDYAIGKRRDLPIINIMNKDGSMNAAAGAYAGMDRDDCRKRLWVR
jgi:valyl-tRNA synthetase